MVVLLLSWTIHISVTTLIFLQVAEFYQLINKAKDMAIKNYRPLDCFIIEGQK